MTRVAILVAVVAAAWLVVRWWEQRRTVAGALPPGLTLITADGCVLCEPALTALEGAAPGRRVRVVDVADAGLDGVLSVPTALAVRPDGTIALQRSGTAAIRDAAALAAAI